MAENSGDTLIEIDFKGTYVEVVTEKGVKIGDNWYPKSHCKALAGYKQGQAVGIVALPQWIVEQKNLTESAQKHTAEKAREIVQKVINRTQELHIICPHCRKDVGIKLEAK